MARVYSRSQGGFIDIPDQQAGYMPMSGEMDTAGGYNSSGIDTDTIMQLYLSGALGNPGSTEAGRYISQLESLGAIGGKQDEEATKKQSEYQEVSGIIAQLLKEWDTIPEEEKGTAKGVLAKMTPDAAARAGLISDRVAAYEKGKKSIAGTLKDIVGETGVLTDADIGRIVGLLPSVSETKGTSDITLQRLDEVFKSKYGQTIVPQKSTQETEVQGSEDLNARKRALINAARQEEGQPPIDGEEGVLIEDQMTGNKGQEFWQRVFNTNKDNISLEGIPDLPYETLGTLAATLLPGGVPGVQGVVGGGGGKFLEELRENGIPLTREEADYQDDPNIRKAMTLGMLGGPIGQLIAGNIAKGRNPEKNSSSLDIANAAGKGAAFDIVGGAALRPFKTLGNIRKSLAGKEEIAGSGERIATRVFDEAQNVPTTMKGVFNKNALSVIDDYAGKEFSEKSLLDILKRVNDRAYTLAGSPGRAGASQFERTVANAIRGELSPKVLAANKVFEQLYKGKKLLGNVGSKLVGPIAQAGATGFVLKKFLGM